MRVLVDSSIPGISNYLQDCFELEFYDNYDTLLAKINDAEILICRSTLKVNADLLKFSKIKCVATASSGSDHIDIKYLQANKIRLIDAKGANAQAVCDYVISVLAWLKNSGYSFANKVGIVGVGAVGSKLWKILQLLGFDVSGYDPLKEKYQSDFKSCALDELYSKDIICIHANLHFSKFNPSFNLFNAKLLDKLKSQVIIINAARGQIVNENDLLKTSNKITYCTDVFNNEPNISKEIVNFATIVTPHIAGHTLDAKNRVVSKIVEDLYIHYAPNYSYKPLDEGSLFKSSVNVQNNLLAIINSAKLYYPLTLESKDLQSIILANYNPYIETQAIKLAANKKNMFLDLRKKHNYRYDFFKSIVDNF